MNNREIFKQMLVMQNEINTVVNPEWKLANYAWHRAVWIECAELIEHHGYKWWKKQTPDWDQITLEVVDIWHFGMSMLLSLDLSCDELAIDLEFQYEAVNQEYSLRQDFIENVEALANKATAGIFDPVIFFDIMFSVDIDIDLLYIMYVGKNVLNKFRQANGYKEGIYLKTWFDGREDNEHLTDIMNSEALKEIPTVAQIPYIFTELVRLYSLRIADTSDIVHSNGC